MLFLSLFHFWFLGIHGVLVVQLLGRENMPPYRQIGSLPRKRHIAHRQEPGYRNEGIYYEEVVTTAGFGRAYSIAYHLRPPTRVRAIEPVKILPVETVNEPVLRH